MRVTSKILDAALETLETSKIKFHSFGSQEAGCVANLNYAHNIDVLYQANSISKFTTIFHLWLTKGIYC